MRPHYQELAISYAHRLQRGGIAIHRSGVFKRKILRKKADGCIHGILTLAAPTTAPLNASEPAALVSSSFLAT